MSHNPNRTAFTETNALLRYDATALKLGFSILDGEDDIDEALDHPGFYGVRTATGTYRSALPDLSGRNSFTAHEILENEEDAHEDEAYEAGMDRIINGARQARPDNSEGVIQAFRVTDLPREFGNCGGRGRKPVIVHRAIKARSADRRAYLTTQTYATKAPVTDHSSRQAFAAKLERTGMKPGRAIEIASKAKIGTLGAKLLASVSKSGATEALNVRPEPAPHRALRIREGVVRGR